jgi:hypothetical protein
VLAVVAALPLAALAQEAAPSLPEDPRAARFREVERGLFAGFDMGYLAIFKTPVADPVKFPYTRGNEGGTAGGFLAGVHVGYDITPRLALAVFVLGSSEKASAAYGAFDVFAAGADLRYAFLALPDANGVERFHAYAHARGGYARTTPQGLFGTSDVLVEGGLGIEYFTRLRHFSVGLAADGLYFTKVKAAGIAVLPTLRYAF